jgi:hypothetical protein
VTAISIHGDDIVGVFGVGVAVSLDVFFLVVGLEFFDFVFLFVEVFFVVVVAEGAVLSMSVECTRDLRDPLFLSRRGLYLFIKRKNLPILVVRHG